MSLVSGWKDIMAERDRNKPEPELMFDAEKKNVGAQTSITEINENSFNTASKEDKLIMVLQLIKGRCEGKEAASLSKTFLELIKDKPIDFFTQKLMPNLADTDAKGRIGISDKSFDDWHALFFEVFHELIHITEMDKVEFSGNRMRTDINKEISNYLFLLSIMDEIFGDKTEEFIDALGKLKDEEDNPLFKIYDVEEMRTKLTEKFGAMPDELASALETLSGYKDLSYMRILREIFNKRRQEREKNISIQDSYKSITADTSNPNSINNAITAFMTINMYA